MKHLLTLFLLIIFLGNITSCGSKSELFLSPEEQKEKDEAFKKANESKAKRENIGNVEDSIELKREEEIEEGEGGGDAPR